MTPPDFSYGPPAERKRSLVREGDIEGALIEADLVATALRDTAFFQAKGIRQGVSVAKNNCSSDGDVRWQPSGSRQIAKGSPQGERGGVHQFGVPPKGNANFA